MRSLSTMLLSVLSLAVLVGAPVAQAADHLLISEIVVTPTAGEFIEIFNPTGAPVDLSEYYITDATYAGGGTYYYNIVTGANAGGGGYQDFHARFPAGATIGINEYQTIALNGSTNFQATYGVLPTYELYEDDGAPDGVPDMREALAGSVNDQGGLSNGGEVVVLYKWNGTYDIVHDVDYIVWGDKHEAVDKTGVALDGPDPGSAVTPYLDDTAIADQDVLWGPDDYAPSGGDSQTRVDALEGAETLTGGNGATGNDETSENTSTTWAERVATPNDGSLHLVQVSIADIRELEGDSGTTNFEFVVSLSLPALAGGVTFDWATSDGTATTADGDYQAASGTGVTIPEGERFATLQAPVFGDTDLEPNETFTVTLSNVSGTNVVLADGSATGEIRNDEILAVNEVQGSGETSPYEGWTVKISGVVVTAVGPEGFFVQTMVGTPQDDGDIDTSEGLYVLTGGTPTVSLEDIVEVVGDVQEFYDFTELVEPEPVQVLPGTGVIPTAVAFDATVPSPDPDNPSCAIEYECYEGMLVEASGLVVGPTQAFGTDPVAEFFGIATPGPRPFREPGAEYPGMAGLPPTIPLFDGNPQIFEIDSDRLGGALVQAQAGDSYSAVGPLGYEYAGWEIWAAAPVTVTPGPDVLQAVPETPVGQMTIGSLNLYRVFDMVDDPSNPNDPVIEPAEYQRRLTKHRRYILEVLRAPDVLAVQEAENITVLMDLATEIATADATVQYTAYLEEGNDFGGMDVGFLVRGAVSGVTVTQLGADETIVPEGYSLHDRPPLLLECVHGDLEPAILGVHTRSMGGVDDPGNDFARRKRLQQATSIADMVQAHQSSSTAPMIVIGDFNAFQFTDGYVDVVGQIRGEVDSAETYMTEPTVTDPVLRDELMEWLTADERYSYAYQGNAQVFDHALTTTTAQAYVAGFAYGRGNTDAPEPLLEDDTTAKGASDHDGLVLYIRTALFADGFESGDASAWSVTQP